MVNVVLNFVVGNIVKYIFSWRFIIIDLSIFEIVLGYFIEFESMLCQLVVLYIIFFKGDDFIIVGEINKFLEKGVINKVIYCDIEFIFIVFIWFKKDGFY